MTRSSRSPSRAVLRRLMTMLRRLRTTPRGRRPTTAPEADAEQTRRPWRELGDVVLTVFGADWARRLGVSPPALREAVLGSPDRSLARRLDAEIGVVDLRFQPAPGPDAPRATTRLSFAGRGARASAEVHLAWSELPDAVRTEFAEAPDEAVWRTWRALGEP